MRMVLICCSWGCILVYGDTVTLFNRYHSRVDGGTWYPTVLHGVDLNVDKAAILATYGAESEDNAKLHVRYRKRNGGIYVANKPYLLPKEWDRQTNDQLPTSLTFTGGADFDFFYVGEWEGGVVTDDDYPAYPDGFYGYMNERFDLVFAITSVAMYSASPHFEIMAR